MPAIEDATPLLEMSGITKDFTGGRVLHGVDLAVQPGRVHALVGENGAGKSTLMKILAGLYPDHGGTISLQGMPLESRSPAEVLRNGVAVIYQEFSLIPDMTVAENIALGREPRSAVPGRLSHSAVTERGVDELREFGLDLPMDRPVRELDVGQQQMTEIAKAVARRARVLVMDEPTARLSLTERERLFGIIRQLADRGVGIVYISHFLEEIFAVCNDVTVLRDGRVVGSQPIESLDLSAITHLMVGDKFDTIAKDTARHRGHVDESLTREVALRLVGVEVPGKVAPTSLVLHRGQVIGIAGLQGAGRTDLVRAIVGSSRLATGRIETPRFSGLPKSPRQAVAAGILMLPASRKTEGILEVRSVRHNIELIALRTDLSRAGLLLRGQISATVTDLMKRFNVNPRNPTLTITSLSGGNQQKALFARAAAAGADVLILDQPTAGVDVGAKVELYDQIDRLVSEGVSILLISDDLMELLRLSDTIMLMHKGMASDQYPVTDFNRQTLLARITGADLKEAS
jgi:ABC-type sugar transport system ATPase subunit